MRKFILAASLTALTASVALGAGDAAAGKAVYERACKTCHTATGDPNPAIAKLNKVEMKSLRSADVQGESDAAVKKAITDGQGKMKPVKNVAGAEIDNVIAYMRTLK